MYIYILYMKSCLLTKYFIFTNNNNRAMLCVTPFLNSGTNKKGILQRKQEEEWSS